MNLFMSPGKGIKISFVRVPITALLNCTNWTLLQCPQPSRSRFLECCCRWQFIRKSPQDALTIIENKSKARNSRSKPIASPVNACDNHSSFELAKLTHAVNQQTSAVTTAMTAMLKQFVSLEKSNIEAGSKDRPPMLAPGIDNDIYSPVDACLNACEMWKAIERMVNHLNRIIQEPSMVDDDAETSKEKEIDKLMALISLSFKKIYKPTNNNLRTSSNTSRANQDNSPRIHRNAGYEHQRLGNVAGARETVSLSVVQKSGIQCYNCKEYGHVARECQKPKRA
nr:hypothetical protein [Tanacetum cinerariifolium]